LGQPVVLLLVGLHRAVRAFQRGDEGQAGFWTAMLLLKPQYGVCFGFVYVYKRRWRAVAGMAAGGLLIVLASFAVAGTEGMQAYVHSLTQFSGFRDVDPTVAPQAMINWRALLINFAPGISEAQGQRLTLALALATAGTLPLVWRGRWDPRSDRFAPAILATVLVTLLASPHSHAHGATLLLVPGLLLLNRTGVTPALKLILGLALVVPTVVFVTSGSVVLTSTVITLGLIAALAALLAAELGLVAAGRPIPSRAGGARRLKPAATCSRSPAYGSAGFAPFSSAWLSRSSSPTARGRSTS
jgi:hypothetical protein